VDPGQVIALYGKRRGVEDFIEEIKNQYHLGRLAAQWLGRAEYARMELCRFSPQFLQTPKALLEWIKAAPKNYSPRRRQRRDQSFLKSPPAFGLSPP